MDINTAEKVTVAFENLTVTDNIIHWNETGLSLVTNQHYVMTVEARNTEGTVNSSIAVSKYLAYWKTNW